jgi:hypothetical protein
MPPELTPPTRQHLADAFHCLGLALNRPTVTGAVPDLHLRQAQLVLTDLIPAEQNSRLHLVLPADSAGAPTRRDLVALALARLDLIPTAEHLDDVVMARNFLAGLLSHYPRASAEAAVGATVEA